MRNDHCWSQARGNPRASFQAGSCRARARASFDSEGAAARLRDRDGSDPAVAAYIAEDPRFAVSRRESFGVIELRLITPSPP